MTVRSMEWFALGDEKSIINKRNDKYENIEIFLGVFQECREIEKGRELIIWERTQTLGPH